MNCIAKRIIGSMVIAMICSVALVFCGYLLYLTVSAIPHFKWNNWLTGVCVLSVFLFMMVFNDDELWRG